MNAHPGGGRHERHAGGTNAPAGDRLRDLHRSGQRGALASVGLTRGVNLSVGAGSVAGQRLQNLINR
jgi:hypothetical protein